MKTFSFSRLSLYQTCPHRFYKKYVEGYTEPLTYPLALGKGVHKAIEEKIRGKSHDEAIFSGFVEAEFHPEVKRNELEWLTNNAPTQQLIDNPEIERHFVLPLSAEKDAPKIQGIIDLIEQNRIRDWKTNRVMYDIRDNHQLGLYSWAISEIEGYKEIDARLNFLRFKRESRFVFTKREMEESRLWAERTAKEIQGKLEMVRIMPELKDELFPATPSSYCSHCPFSKECFQKFSPYN